MISKTARILTIVVCIAVMCGIAAAQTPPNPVPDPGGPVNVYYGATPSNFNGSLPLVFVHGLDGEAQDWWVGNNMYAMMYQAGYKTCFININVDGTRSKGSVASDAQVLAGLFPGIAARFGVPQFTLITHSKGANDSEAAMLTPSVSQFVNAVYQISPPNEGTQLANWAFGPGIGLAAVLGLLSPGVYGLQTSAVGTFRKVADPIFAPLEIPFYYSAGDTDKGATIGGIVTAITGTILAGLTGNEPNDGLVPVPNTVLPVTYGVNLGLIDANHFTTLQGSYSFDRTNAQIQAATNNQGFPSNGVANQGFELAAPQGFGDRNNSLAWSQAWFQGKLYVGTGRAFACVQAAASDALSGTHYYSQNLGATIQCTPTPQELPLQAEIWQYTPENNTWVRVYQSPNTVPVAWDSNGTPTQYTALDIGYRGMGVFQEPTGPALYIGGVSASEMFDQTGPYATGTPFPGPRILRTTDGVNFAPIPMDPGTFLGGLGNLDANDRVRSYRTFVSYSSSGGGDAKTTGSSSLTASLFVTAADFYGTGVVIQSSQPWLGNNAWFQVTPPKAQMPVWNLAVFNNYLYAVGGDRLLDPNAAIGYFLSKTTATGPAPYNWIPVITEGGFQSDQTLRSPDALSIAVFNNAIYIGSDRPAEMLRAYADDTFDVVVGLPRMTPQGMKYPLSGITTGFGNFFTGHFWRMTTYNNELYMSTWDWSYAAEEIQGFFPLKTFLKNEFGFDLYKTADGVNWKPVTFNGFGDHFNEGGRTLLPTPIGMFVGSMNNSYGFKLYRDQSILDLNGDGVIDQRDVTMLLQSLNKPATSATDPRDLDQDGKITVLDARKLALQCTKPGCAIATAPAMIPAPQSLQAAAQVTVGQQATLTWQPVAGAVQYHVFRMDPEPVSDLLSYIIGPGAASKTSLQDACGFFNGGSDCNLPAAAHTGTVNGQNSGAPTSGPPTPNTVTRAPARWIATTTSTTFTDPNPPAAGLQAIYFVKAEGSNNQLSILSNIVGAPSQAAH